MNDAVRPLSKQLARQEFRRLRRGLDPAVRAAAGPAMAAHALAMLPGPAGPGSTVAAYLSAGTEPGTEELLQGLAESGFSVVVPVCEPEFQLSWCRWKPGIELGPGLFPSIPEPVGPRVSAAGLPEPEAIFVPALAVDAAGIRMGKGGGYYDRFLAGLRAAGRRIPAVAMVYGHELVSSGTWSADGFDQPVDAVLTPAGWTPLPLEPVYT